MVASIITEKATRNTTPSDGYSRTVRFCILRARHLVCVLLHVHRDEHPSNGHLEGPRGPRAASRLEAASTRAEVRAVYILRGACNFRCNRRSDAAGAARHWHVSAGGRCCAQCGIGVVARDHLQLRGHSSPVKFPVVADIWLRRSDVRQQFCHCGNRFEILPDRFFKSPVFPRNGDHHGAG